MKKVKNKKDERGGEWMRNIRWTGLLVFFLLISSGFAEPEIVKVEKLFNKLTAETSGTIKIRVKNVDDTTSDFVVKLKCDDVLVTNPTQQITGIDPNEVRSVSFTVIGTQTIEAKDVKCEATATDIYTFKSDKKSFSFIVEPRKECRPGEVYTVKEGGYWKVYKCVDGILSHSKLLISCEEGYYPKEKGIGGWYCEKMGNKFEIDTLSFSPLFYMILGALGFWIFHSVAKKYSGVSNEKKKAQQHSFNDNRN